MRASEGGVPPDAGGRPPSTGVTADPDRRGVGTGVGAGLMEVIIGFLTDIGIPIRQGTVIGSTTVPGITIAEGGLILDPAAPSHAGDLLHEAGHLALLPPSRRATAAGALPTDLGAGLELGAICWSVAAAWHLGVDLACVFHPDGYRGDSAWLVETYEGGTYPGLPLLQWAGLAWTPGTEPDGEAPFPAMRQWLRTTETAGPA